MTFEETVKWLSTKSYKETIEFCELLLSEMTIMNRAMWDDSETSDKIKIDCLKWSNELAHRIWNLLFELKQGVSDGIENELVDNIDFYRNQTNELAGHLGATLKGTINRYYYIKDNN